MTQYQPTEQRIETARKRIALLEEKQRNARTQLNLAASAGNRDWVERWRKVDRSCCTSIRRWKRIIEGKEA